MKGVLDTIDKLQVILIRFLSLIFEENIVVGLRCRITHRHFKSQLKARL
jgi:hypothetical protein